MNIIKIPGSKSLTNRALIIASFAKGKSVIKNASKSADSLVLVKALRKLGISGGNFKPFKGLINTGDAGTATRFLTAVCTLVPGEIILDGSPRMRQRPISDLVEALNHLGARIIYTKKKGFLPLKIFGGKITGGTVSIRGEISSQFITALLLIGPLLKNGLIIKIIGKLVSKSYVDMTIDCLKKFGIKVINENNRKFTILKNQKYKATKFIVEGDASGASYFWGFAAVTGRKIRVTNINPQSIQGDIKFPDLLKKMGCQIKKDFKNYWIEVKGPKILKGIEVNMIDMPDTAQTLAVVASFARGITRITGLSTLRFKETDRLKALHIELKKMGIKNSIDDDSIVIFGGKPKKAVINTYSDHRMAMAFAVAAAKIPEIIIKDPNVVSKSFPDFWEKVNSLGIVIKHI